MNKIFLVGQAEVTSKVGGGITVFVNMCNLFAKTDMTFTDCVILK